jgi:signal transduction histidine kinase
MSCISPQIEEARRQARKMEVFGQMTVSLAHDLNNMLQGVAGALDVMQTRIDRGQTREISDLLQLAQMSLHRTSAFTHSLLAFSRPHRPDLQPLAVNKVIAAMEPLLRLTLGDRIEFALALAEGSPLTICDRHQLENALLNLAINARDAMPGGGRLVIETYHAELGAERANLRRGRYIGIRVSDTGSGMAPEVAEHAFDPFYHHQTGGPGNGHGADHDQAFRRTVSGLRRVEECARSGNLDHALSALPPRQRRGPPGGRRGNEPTGVSGVRD